MKTTYTVKREDSQGRELERQEFNYFNRTQIQTIFDAMVLNATEGDSIEYCKIDEKRVNPIMYVEIIRGKPYTFTTTGKLKEYTITQRL